MSTGRRLAAGVVTVLLAALPGCSAVRSAAAPPSVPPSASSGQPSSGQPSSGQPSSGQPGVPTPEHVLVVVLENKDAGAVVGAAAAPYLTSLARAGANFTDAHGETHPSQPNYLALFSGSTHGVGSDHCPLRLSGPTLAGQLLAAGRTFTGYSEDLPRAGFTGCTAGGYARKHAPWVDFPDLPPSVNQPLSALPADRAALPTVAFVVPNLCHDTHDCPVAAGDAWARAHLAGYVAWAQAHNSLLVVTFDEDEGTAGNRIPTFLVGPMVRPGQVTERIDHYTLLRTIEEMYGLPPIGRAADAAPIGGIWTQGG